MNIWDIIISAVIVAIAAAAIIVIIKNKTRGKGCCGDCSQCGGCVYGQKDERND